MRYFSKALVSNTISAAGKNIPFIEVAAGAGVIATEDQSFIEALDIRIRERRGGIYELTKEQYDEELKKKNDSPSLPPRSVRQGISLADLSVPTSNAPAVEEVSEAKPVKKIDPVSEPSVPADPPAVTATTRPSTAKIKR